MRFVFPEFLWALLFLIVPILVHLFNFRKIKKVYFSDISLLKEVKTETNAFRRIKHFLILLARLGAVAFLVLAFAQPYIPSPNRKNIQNAGNLVSIYLDNSYSMQNETGNEKYLDFALRNLQQLAKVFPAQTQFQLITNQFENKEQYPLSAQKFADRLVDIKFAPNYRSLATIQKRQNDLVNRYAPNRKNQIFWLSDFQKSTLGDLNKIKLDSSQQYYIVPIKADNTPNVAIDSIWLENPFVKPQTTNQLNVKVRNFGTENFPNFTLKLFLDNQQVSTTTLNLTSKGSLQAQFNFTVSSGGWKQGKVSFEDFPVVFDNEYFFSLNASPQIDILHLFDSNPTSFVKNVFSNENAFNINSQNVNNIDVKKVENMSFIVLDEVRSISGELARIITQEVQKGATLLVIPTTQGGEGFKDFLSGFGVKNYVFEKNEEQSENAQKTTAELGGIDLNQPFFKGIFEKIPQNMQMPYAGVGASWQNSGENLLNFKNKRPFLSKFQAQKGTVYLCASPFRDAFTNFPKHAIFVPVMYQMAMLSKTAGERLAYTFQDRIIKIKTQAPPKNQLFELVKDKLKLTPSQRWVDGELTLEIPEQATDAGFYSLRLGKENIRNLAFNYEKSESNMDFYSANEIQSIFGKNKNVQVYDILKSKNFVQGFQERNLQYNLWKYMLIVVLCCLALEIALMRLLK